MTSVPVFSLTRATMLRPSGVSSAAEERREASIRSARLCPSTGTNSAACLLPRVIVPVLSRRRTFTSPAASIARPERATTFLWKSRSIPAIPIAGSSAAMVVGARQTKSATRTTGPTGAPVPLAAAL